MLDNSTWSDVGCRTTANIGPFVAYSWRFPHPHPTFPGRTQTNPMRSGIGTGPELGSCQGRSCPCSSHHLLAVERPDLPDSQFGLATASSQEGRESGMTPDSGRESRLSLTISQSGLVRLVRTRPDSTGKLTGLVGSGWVGRDLIRLGSGEVS